jgi:hypothetical protein
MFISICFYLIKLSIGGIGRVDVDDIRQDLDPEALETRHDGQPTRQLMNVEGSKTNQKTH